MKRIGIASLLAWALTPMALSQIVGEHSSFGYSNHRTGFNTQAGDVGPPLRLERSIPLRGIDHPVGLSVFDGFLLVSENRPVRYTLLDRLSGEAIWSLTLGASDEASTFAPAFADDIVLLGGASTVLGVRASTGAELWRDSTAGSVDKRHPALVGGVAVYLGSDKLVAAQALTGDVLWQLPFTSFDAPISLNGSRIFVLDQNQALHAFDLLSGQELWTETDPITDPVTSLSLSNQLNTDQAVWVSGLKQSPGSGVVSVVRAVKPSTGENLWNKPLEVTALPGLLLGQGRLVGIGGSLLQGHVAAYNPATGDLIWSTHEKGADIAILPPPGSILGHAQVAGRSILYANFGLSRIQFRDLFSGRLIWSLTAGASAFCTAGGRLYAFADDQILVYAPSHEIFFPHLADGEGQTSLLILSNSASSPASGRVEFFDDEGLPLELTVEGSGLVTSVNFTIPAGESKSIRTTGTGQLSSGWAKVVPDGRGVSGSLVFQFSLTPGDIRFEAGVGAAKASDVALVPVVNQGSNRTAFAVANPFDIATTLSLKLMDSGGELKGETTLDLPARGHRARFAEQLFDQLTESEFQGQIVIESGLPFVVTALRTRDGLQLSSLPVGSGQ